MIFVFLFLIMMCFFILGIFNSINDMKKIINTGISVNKTTEDYINELLKDNDIDKESFKSYNSIKDMNDDEKIRFYKYIINNLYAKLYRMIHFKEEIYLAFKDEYNNEASDSSLSIKELEQFKYYLDNNINLNTVLSLLNNNNLIFSNLQEKILINNSYYIVHFKEEHSSEDYRKIIVDMYNKLIIINEDNIDLVLQHINNKGYISLDMYREKINEFKYNEIKSLNHLKL